MRTSASAQGCLFLLDHSTCGANNNKKGPDGVWYCRAHANTKLGLITRKPGGSTIPRKHVRLHCKRPAAALLAPVFSLRQCSDQMRKTCAYIIPGKGQCRSLVRTSARCMIDGEWYCKAQGAVLHKGRRYAPRAAIMQIEAHRDDLLEAFNVGPMAEICPHCNAFMFEGEKVGHDGHFNLCCGNGKLRFLWGGGRE